MKQKREREEPCDVCGHYHDYHGGEPCAVCGHRLDAPAGGGAATAPAVKSPSAFPSEIIPGFLFLGSYDHASRHEILKTLGIGNILSTVPSCQALYRNSFVYHTVSSSPPPLEECFNFLEEVQREKGKVLVHCMSGLSRSPAVVIYYLMRRNSWRLSEAYHWVKDRRPVIAITKDDAERLQQAEAAVLGAAASGFQVPVGQQTAAGPGGQAAPGAAPFGWPALSSGGSMWGAQGLAPAAAAQQPAHTLNPGQRPSLNFSAAPAQGPFVFGAEGQQAAQQVQQAQQHDMME